MAFDLTKLPRSIAAPGPLGDSFAETIARGVRSFLASDFRAGVVFALKDFVVWMGDNWSQLAGYLAALSELRETLLEEGFKQLIGRGLLTLKDEYVVVDSKFCNVMKQFP